MTSQNSPQYRSDSRNTSWMWRPSLVRYDPMAGLNAGPRPAAARGSMPWSAERTSEESVHIAVARRHTSTTDPVPVRVRFKSAVGDTEGERHATVPVAHGAALADRIVVVGWGENVSEPSSGPERRGVVAGHTRIRSLHPVAVPTGETRAVLLQELPGVQPEPTQPIGPQAGQEDVGCLQELMEQVLTAIGAEVDGHRSLAPVGQGHREVHAACVRPDPLSGESTVGIPRGGRSVRRRHPNRQGGHRRPGRTPIGPVPRRGRPQGSLKGALSHLPERERAQRRECPDRCAIGTRRSSASDPA